MAFKLSPERVSLVEEGRVCVEDTNLQTEGTAREGWEQESPSVPLGTLKVCAVEHRRRRSGEGTLDVQGLAKDVRFLPGADGVH